MNGSRAVLLTVGFICIAALLSTTAAQEGEGKIAKQRARDFLTTLGKADADKLKDYYAPKVLIKGGSELLRPEWNLNPDGDFRKDLEVERDKLLTEYAKLIANIGNRWTDLWSRTLKEEGRITMTHAREADKPFGGVKKDDLVARVRPGKSDDAFIYVLRADAKGQWRVVVEGADY